MARGSEIELVPAARYAVLQRSTEVVSVMQANMGDQTVGRFDLEQIRVPSGGATSWEVPTLDGLASRKELDGIIVGWRDVRQFWQTSYDESGGGTPPDCSSDDCVTGIGTPGGDCATCPYAQWGSSVKGGQAQACRQTRLMLFVMPDSLLPYVLVVPPSSLGDMRKHFLRLAGAATPFYGVVTRLALNKTSNPKGIPYSEIVPTVASRLSDEERSQIESYAKSVRPILYSMQASTIET